MKARFGGFYKRRFPSSMRIAPNWRRFVHAFLSLQSADWIAGTVLRSLSLPWKIAFPDGGSFYACPRLYHAVDVTVGVIRNPALALRLVWHRQEKSVASAISGLSGIPRPIRIDIGLFRRLLTLPKLEKRGRPMVTGWNFPCGIITIFSFFQRQEN